MVVEGILGQLACSTCFLGLDPVLLLLVVSSQLAGILPLAMVHTLSNLFTNTSLGKVAISFTHTVKAMEPLFLVVLSAMFLGQMVPYNMGCLFSFTYCWLSGIGIND